MDRTEAGTVPSSHVLVEAPDGIGTRQFAEFLVHIVCAGTRVITEPDAEVLDLHRLLFVNLCHKGAKGNTMCQRMHR